MASQAAMEIVLSLHDEASKPIAGVASSITNLGKQSEQTHGLLKGMLTGAGFAAFNAGLSVVSSGFQSFTGFIGDSIQESRDAAAGLAQTEAVIKSTGGAAGVTAKQIVDMAGALSHTTLFTDDAIQAGENMTLTFTNIGKEVFPQVTSTVLDMATALHSTPEAMAQMTGKALSSADGVSALRRVGVQFTDAQEAMVKQLFATGDAVGAQRIVLGELATEFGGSAEAAAQADGGFHLFNQRLDDVKQTIGDALQPALTQVMGLLSGPVLDAVEGVATSLAGRLPGAIAWLTDAGIPALISGWQTVQPVFAMVGSVITDTIVPAFGIARDGILTFIQALQGDWVNSSGILPLHQAIGELGLFISGTLVPAFQTLVEWIGQNATLFGTVALQVGAAFAAFSAISGVLAIITAAFAALVSPIGLVVLAVGALALAWNTDFLGIQTSLTAWWNGTGQPIFTQLRTWLAVTIPAAIAVLAGFWTGTLQPALSAVWSFITGSVIPTLTTLATGAMVAVGTAATTLAGFWTGTLQPALTTVWSFIQNSIVPLFEALANVYIAALNLEVTAAAGFWQNVLYPALSTVWSFISSSLQPVISSLASFFTGTLNPAVTAAGNTLSTVLGPAITAVTGFFGSLYTAIGGISGAISTVIGWLNSLASRLNSLKLPDWLTPGSPTPFEWGLRGIADAAQLATKALDPLLARANGMTAPNLSTPVEKASGGGPFSYQNGGGIDDAKQAGTDAGLKFGDGWKAGIEQIAPVLQDSTRLAFQQLHDVVLLPWQTMTNDFFSGAGFGFIGQASIGINSAGNGLATSAGNVGGAAGASLVSGLRGNIPGVTQAVNDINAAIANTLKTSYTVTVNVVQGGAPTTDAHLPSFGGMRAAGGPVQAGKGYIVGERQAEMFYPQTSGRILPSVPQAGSTTVQNHYDFSMDLRGSTLTADQVQGAIERAIEESERKNPLLASTRSYGLS